MLDFNPVAGGALFLYSIAFAQAANDAESLAAPGSDIEFIGSHFALLDKAHVHPCLTGNRHTDLEPIHRFSLARRGHGHLGQHSHLVTLAELGDALPDQAGTSADVYAVGRDDTQLSGSDFADDIFSARA